MWTGAWVVTSIGRRFHISYSVLGATRQCYRIRIHHGRKGERHSLSEADYMRLVDGAHQLLRAARHQCLEGHATTRSVATDRPL